MEVQVADISGGMTNKFERRINGLQGSIGSNTTSDMKVGGKTNEYRMLFEPRDFVCRIPQQFE